MAFDPVHREGFRVLDQEGNLGGWRNIQLTPQGADRRDRLHNPFHLLRGAAVERSARGIRPLGAYQHARIVPRQMLPQFLRNERHDRVQQM